MYLDEMRKNILHCVCFLKASVMWMCQYLHFIVLFVFLYSLQNTLDVQATQYKQFHHFESQ